jgi:hypothetical protein
MCLSACLSSHSIANVKKHLIASFQPNQAGARVFNIKDDVHNDHGDECESVYVKPASGLASLQGTQQLNSFI